MKITEKLFREFLHCEHKAYLLLRDESGQKSEYEILQNELHDAYVLKVCGTGIDAAIFKSVFSSCAPGSSRELLRDFELNYENISTSCEELLRTRVRPPTLAIITLPSSFHINIRLERKIVTFWLFVRGYLRKRRIIILNLVR